MPYVRLLGTASLEGDGGSISGPAAQPRRLAVLALLASAHPRAIQRDKLLALLWPEKEPERGRNLLNQAVHHLRKAVDAEAIESSGEGLSIDASVLPSDLVEFTEAVDAGRWRAAVEHYAGPLLDGFHLGGAGAFERWADEERRRLADRHREALEKLAEAAEAADAWTRAAAWWKERAAEDPLNSRVACRLMEALAAGGNVAGALEHGRRHERLLRDELGIPATGEVRGLLEKLAGDAGRARPAASRERPPANRTGADGFSLRRGDESSRGRDREPPRGAEPPRSSAPTDRERTGRRAGGRGAVDARRPTAAPEDGSGRPAISGRLIAFVVLATAVAGWVFAAGAGNGGEGRPTPIAPANDSPTLVVLPFENLGVPGDEHLADGITEQLIVRLASVSDLGVIDRTSAFRYESAASDVRRIGEELGVDYALVGTVHPETGPGGERRLRVASRLVRSSDGTRLWTRTYARDLADIFAIQAEIAADVVGELGVAVDGTEAEALSRRPTQGLEAYDHFLQGNAYLARHFSADAARAAIAQYERAVEADPGFAEAWRRLIHARLWLTWVFDDEEQGRLARRDLDRLVESGARGPEVRLARGWFLYYGERKYAAALREFEAVRRRRPGDGEVLRAVGFLQLRLGRWEEAQATQQEALELSPRDAELAFAIGKTLQARGRYTEALAYYERAFSLAPEEDIAFLYSNLEHLHLALDDTLRAREVRDRARALGAAPWLGGRAEFYRGDLRAAAERIRRHPVDGVSRLFRHDNLADAYGRIGDDERRDLHADSLLELAAARAPEDWDRPLRQAANAAWIFAGLALIHLGERDAGLRRVRRGLDLEAPFDDALTTSFLDALAARAFVRAGRYEEAIERLESARSVPRFLSRYDLRHDPEWDPLRDHPGFRRLLE